MGKVIGIDLGTTNSVCAILDGGEPKVLVSDEGGRVTPSVVGFAKDGTRFVGDIAKRQLLINPTATIHSIKRFMGKSLDEVRGQLDLVHYNVTASENGMATVEIDGRNYSPQEIASLILEKVKHSAENYLGDTCTEAVITVPAYFTDSQRQATRDAGTIAGLDVLRIINEPTAAALSYVHYKNEPSCIAVYDWGGGTFDISLLRVDKDIAEVLSTRGNNILGGGNVDQCIVRWLVGVFAEETGIDVSSDNVVMQRLQDAAERAKIELSSTTSTEVHLPFLLADEAGPKHLQAKLTRDAFEDLCRDLFVETIDECKQALVDANLDPADIDEIVMVGGSSRIPMIQTMVKDLFGRELNRSFNPDEVVAIGAAIQASMLGGETKAVTLLDVTNFSLGMEVEGRRMAKLIPKNTTIPTQVTKLASTVQDDQSVVKIHVLQGEDEDAANNVSLGEFEIHNIQPGPRGGPRIEVCFSIDTNGIVTVSAEDKRTGVGDEIVIESPIGLSQSELDDIRNTLYGDGATESVELDDSYDVDDDTTESGNENLDVIKGEVDGAMAHLEAQLLLHKASMDEEQISHVQQLLDSGQNALSGDDGAVLEEVLLTLRNALNDLEDL